MSNPLLERRRSGAAFLPFAAAQVAPFRVATPHPVDDARHEYIMDLERDMPQWPAPLSCPIDDMDGATPTAHLELPDDEFILVTPGSIGMDKNGDTVPTPPPIPPLHSFLPIHCPSDLCQHEAATKLAVAAAPSLGGRFHLPMKRSPEPFESLLF